MTISAGIIEYTYGSHPCSGIGLQWTEKNLKTALKSDVVSVLFDDKGAAEITSFLTNILDTDFSKDGLSQILNSQPEVSDWRVGEAIAESYLVDHRACYFPWSADRDKRNARSSLPGADLVGLTTDSMGDCIVFGEIKTSHQNKYPPDVMRKPNGLTRQLKRLRDNKNLRDFLFQYLAHRALYAPWHSRFKTAAKRYLQNNPTIHLYGVLIRDVPPKVADLRSSVQELADSMPDGTVIEILALYLPDGCILGINKTVAMQRSGGMT